MDRVHRPSAQQVVDQLSDLKRMFGENLDHSPKCCNPTTPIGNHHHARLLRLFPFHKGLDNPIDKIFFDLGDYLRVVTGTSYEYIFLDMDFSWVHLPAGCRKLGDCLKDEHAIIDTCSLLYANASRTGATKEFWTAQKENKPPKLPDEVDPDIALSLDFSLLKHLVFTVKKISVYTALPGVSTSSSTVDCMAVISLLPIWLPKSSYLGTFLYMISFRTSGEQLRCVDSTNEIIDLTI